MSSQFIRDIQAMEDSLKAEEATHAKRIRVLEALAEANRDHATDAEIAHALVGTGLTEAQLKRRLQAFDNVVHKMVNSIYAHVRLEFLERGNGPSE